MSVQVRISAFRLVHLAEHDYDSNYNWYQYFNDQMTASGLTATEIGYVKIWSSDYPKVPGHLAFI